MSSFDSRVAERTHKCRIMFIPLSIVLTFALLNQGEAFVSGVKDILTRKKCFDDLGCFEISSPFYDVVKRPVALFPEKREKIDTKFLLYTPSNPTHPKTFSNRLGTWKKVLDSDFNPAIDTKFIIHGYNSKSFADFTVAMANELMKANGSNVFVVDWSGGEGPIYEQAVANARLVGAEVALFIQRLQNLAKIKPESVHLIGHSLGSHVSGYAGKRVKNLGRITGLDPAGPYFTNVVPIVRLDRKDALLVDVIHTDVAPSVFKGLGLAQSIGHFDFYPNGGSLQPGCKEQGAAIFQMLMKLKLKFDQDSLREMFCNHWFIIDLFRASLRTSSCKLEGVVCDSWEKFVAGKCGSCDGNNKGTCLPLGIDLAAYSGMKKSDRSINVYLKTTDSDPFC